jgi:group I intron endonuclease
MNISKTPIIGIYKITSPTGKIYIGQSINIKNRKESYRRGHCKQQPKIYNSINKHGWNKHQHEIIEECSLEQLNEREIYWKQYYVDQYGWGKMLFCELYDSGGGPKSQKFKEKNKQSHLGKKHSIEIRDKIRQSHLGKKRPLYVGDNISKSNKGKKKIRIKTRKDIGIPKSDEVKEKMSLAKIGKISTNPKKPILQFTIHGVFIKEWDSITSAGDFFNIPYGNITNCCKGLRKQIGGFVWKYKTN